MMRHRLAARGSGEGGFTIIELLVTMILIGILAAIALAVFLNQQDKGKDASIKSDVNNLARIVQACNAGGDAADDYRNCDTESDLQEHNLSIGSEGPNEISSGDCADPVAADTVAPPGKVRIVEAGRDCFTVLGISGSGNRFWYVKHNDGSATRDCTTHNSTGCPADGDWAG